MTDATHSDTFDEELTLLVQELKRGYQRGINRDLSQHNSQGLFSRHANSLVENLLARSAPLVDLQMAQTKGKSEAGHLLWQGMVGKISAHKEALVDYALNFNRSSCALSNFPQEHYPSADYFTEVLAEVERKWLSWCELMQAKLTQKQPDSSASSSVVH